MKQHITLEQLNELREKQKEKLIKWYKIQPEQLWTLKENLPNSSYYWSGFRILEEMKHNEDMLPVFSIGQMIEFLEPHLKMTIEHEVDMWFVDDYYNERELCDALWEAVKEVLNKEKEA